MVAASGTGQHLRTVLSPPAPILEIGHTPFLKQMRPDQTSYVALGAAPPDPRADMVVSRDNLLTSLPRLWSLLRAPEVTLICVRIHHAPGRAARLLNHLLPMALGVTKRLIVLDFEDEDTIHPAHWRLLATAHLVFKRELPLDRWRLLRPPDGAAIDQVGARGGQGAHALIAKFRPLPLGLPLSPERHAIPTEPLPKSADIFFSGRVENSAWERPAGLAALRRLAAEGVTVDIPDARLPPEQFYRRCAAAWLTWSPAGFGWDCFRHYEAAACGSVPLMPFPAIERHAPARDGDHAVFYDPTEGGLETAARRALADRDRLARMALAARAHAFRHHTPEAIATRIVDQALAP